MRTKPVLYEAENEAEVNTYKAEATKLVSRTYNIPVN